MPIPSVRVARRVIVDSGFWIALFNERDENHNNAGAMLDALPQLTIVVPWPTLYETINTRLVRRPLAVQRFEALIKGPNVTLLDDLPYRADAIEVVFTTARTRPRPLSLVDLVIRSMLLDINVRVDALLTCNQGDFADVCRRRRIEMLWMAS